MPVDKGVPWLSLGDSGLHQNQLPSGVSLCPTLSPPTPTLPVLGDSGSASKSRCVQCGVSLS